MNFFNEDKLNDLLNNLSKQVKHYESQLGFENTMVEINGAEAQTLAIVIDKQDEINAEIARIKVELQKLELAKAKHRQQWHTLEMERKDVARMFHGLKHRLVMLNRKEK